jgi:hypothetical protein
MPMTFNGCGTSYYGKRYPAEDGSYVTTLWVTALWVPLLPLRSYRVRPMGKGTTAVVYNSRSYQTLRVPICWPQVRNVYLCISPILALVLYFGWPDIQQWWKQDILRSAPPSALTPALAPEPPQFQPDETNLPLDAKAAAIACGNVLKLDKTESFVRLNLITRLHQLVNDTGFTDEEFKDVSSAKDLGDEAFKAYGFGYISWEKSKEVSRADFDGMVTSSGNKALSSTELSSTDSVRLQTYLMKFKRMMLKAFDLGRHDANLSPCPF